MALFNPEALNSLYEIEDTSPGLVLQLVQEYEISSEKLIADLLHACEKRDSKKIEMAAHTLVSSSKMLGLEKIAQHCVQIEKNAHLIDIVFQDIHSMPSLYKESLSLLKDFTTKKQNRKP